MEELATSLLATLKRTSAPIETKLSLLNSLKSSIKHQRIPENAQPVSIECIRIAITTQTSPSLVTAGFGALGHLVKRLVIQEQTNALFSQRANLLPLLLDRLGDAREVHRASASQALCDLWPVRQVEVEKLIREDAVSSSNPRLKEAGMDWVAKMHTTQQLPFRAFVPAIIECLEDADSTVRESAKGNIITLFVDARDAAKADLKRQLAVYNVRKSIASFILSQLQVQVPLETPANVSSSATRPPELATHEQTAAPSASTLLGSSVSVETSIEPLYVQSQRELEDMFRIMGPCFEDKEKEDNWKARDTNVTKIRRLLRGNALTEYHNILITSIKSLLDGILKVANSLRTTMSTNGCQLVQEMAKILGSALDPMVEIILQGFEKMSASTKHISAQNADVTIDTIFSSVSYNIRLVQHVWHATQDKNVQPRCLTAGWLKTLLKRQMQNRSQFDSTGGLELADKSIRRGLIDANPKVREAMRGTYWTFAQGWPERAETIMSTLDTKSRQLLQKDPSNPDSSVAVATFTSSVGPTSASNPRAAPSTSRSSLKETIAAQKKAALLAAKKGPERPTSAMSSFSPVRQAPPSTTRPVAPPPTASQVRAITSVESNLLSRPPLTSTVSSTGGLLSAPMRRPKRPEMTRPATADLYTNKRDFRTATPPQNSTGGNVRNEAKSPRGKISIDSPEAAKIRSIEKTSRFVSPRISPVRTMQQMMHNVNPATTASSAAQLDSTLPSPSNEENMTMIIPNAEAQDKFLIGLDEFRTDHDQMSNGTSSLPTTMEEDNFTMVIFDKAQGQTTRPSDAAKSGSITAVQPLPADKTASYIQSGETHFGSIDFALQPVCNVEALPAPRIEKPREEDLIVFEDPTIEDVGVPDIGEAQRLALEELHLNKQVAKSHVETVVLPRPEDNLDERPISPSKDKLVAEQPYEHRAETLKVRRLVRSGIDRIKTRTLDIYGFRRLQELVKKSPRNDDPPFPELFNSLVDYIRVVDASAEAPPAHDFNLNSQALACIRALVALPSMQDKAVCHADALYVLAVAAGTCERVGRYADELEDTAGEVISHSVEHCTSHLNALLRHDWNRGALRSTVYRRTLPAALLTMSKLMAAARTQGKELSDQQRTELGNLAVRCLTEVDVEVRQAGTEFCLEIYKTFGKEGEAGFWKAITNAGEGQMNLVAYYLVKKKAVW